MKIAALERASGVGRSTIHHYLNIGLLPPPTTVGPKLHLFGEDHLALLAEIRTLRAEGLALPQIRHRLAKRRRIGRGAHLPARPGENGPSGSAGTGAMHERILDHAARRFAELGYSGVRLTDLAAELAIGKATLYRHFASKQTLFVACVERVRFTLIPQHVRERLERDVPLEHQVRLRVLAVLVNFDKYRTFANLLASVAHGSDPELARRARAEQHAMITNAEPMLRKMIGLRAVRSRDSELLAYMLWGALMGAGERLSLDDRYTLEHVLEHYLAFVTGGM